MRLEIKRYNVRSFLCFEYRKSNHSMDHQACRMTGYNNSSQSCTDSDVSNGRGVNGLLTEEREIRTKGDTNLRSIPLLIIL